LAISEPTDKDHRIVGCSIRAVPWNMKQIALLVERWRAEGHTISDADLALTSPLVRRHIHPYGRYHFDLTRLERASPPEGSPGA